MSDGSNRDWSEFKQGIGGHKATYKGRKSGVGSPAAMRDGTAAWPGVPGKTQGKSRAGGAPTSGYSGAPFYVKKEGL